MIITQCQSVIESPAAAAGECQMCFRPGQAGQQVLIRLLYAVSGNSGAASASEGTRSKVVIISWGFAP